MCGRESRLLPLLQLFQEVLLGLLETGCEAAERFLNQGEASVHGLPGRLVPLYNPVALEEEVVEFVVAVVAAAVAAAAAVAYSLRVGVQDELFDGLQFVL